MVLKYLLNLLTCEVKTRCHNGLNGILFPIHQLTSLNFIKTLFPALISQLLYSFSTILTKQNLIWHLSNTLTNDKTRQNFQVIKFEQPLQLWLFLSLFHLHHSLVVDYGLSVLWKSSWNLLKTLKKKPCASIQFRYQFE